MSEKLQELKGWMEDNLSTKVITAEDVLEKIKEMDGPPVPEVGKNWQAEVIDAAISYVNDVWERGYGGVDDADHYVMESVVQAVFGTDIFNKLNDRDTELSRS